MSDIVKAILDEVRTGLLADCQTPFPTSDPLRVKEVSLGEVYDDPNDFYPLITLFHDDTLRHPDIEPEVGGGIWEIHKFRLEAEYHDTGTKEQAHSGASTLQTRLRNSLTDRFDLGGLVVSDGTYVVGLTKEVVKKTAITLGGGPDDEWRPHIHMEIEYVTERP